MEKVRVLLVAFTKYTISERDSHYTWDCIFSIFGRLVTLVLWRKIVQNLLIFTESSNALIGKFQRNNVRRYNTIFYFVTFAWFLRMFFPMFLRFPPVFFLFPRSVSPVSYFRFCVIFVSNNISFKTAIIIYIKKTDSGTILQTFLSLVANVFDRVSCSSPVCCSSSFPLWL